MSSSGSDESKGQKITVTVRPGREYLPPKPVGGGDGQECHEEVSRRGELQPCEKVAVALRKDPTFGIEYPVCAFHTRADMVALAVVVARERAAAWDEGERHESEYLATWGQFCPNPQNPYRVVSRG